MGIRVSASMPKSTSFSQASEEQFMAQGGALERYRVAVNNLRMADGVRPLLPTEDVRECMMTLAALLRRCGRRIQRMPGCKDALDELDATIDDFGGAMERRF